MTTANDNEMIQYSYTSGFKDGYLRGWVTATLTEAELKECKRWYQQNNKTTDELWQRMIETLSDKKQKEFALFVDMFNGKCVPPDYSM